MRLADARWFDRPVRVYIAVAFGYSWALAAAGAATGGSAPPRRRFAISALFMLAPALGALATRRVLPADTRTGALGLAPPIRA